MSKRKAHRDQSSAHQHEDAEHAGSEDERNEGEGEGEGETRAERGLTVPAVRARVADGVREVMGGARRVVGRGAKLVKDHPTATAAVAVGAGAAIIEAELAAAALVGMGVTMLVTRKSGPELRSEIGTWVRRGRTRLAGQLARLEQVIAPEAPTEAPQRG
jgi:hypothetical protein